MVQGIGDDGLAKIDPVGGPSPGEWESYSEHQAALEATLFRADADPYELVLELEAGQLRLRRPPPR